LYLKSGTYNTLCRVKVDDKGISPVMVIDFSVPSDRVTEIRLDNGVVWENRLGLEVI